MTKTEQQFNQVIDLCKELFLRKMKDYGTSWRIMRPKSITDQLYIKARRIQSIELKGEQLVEDNIVSEFIGLINYGIIGLIQLDLPQDATLELSEDKANKLYSEKVQIALNLMLNKNHDYGEAWREMRVSSYTDLILTKIFRIKQIEDNSGQTIVSEGVDANYLDIINYAIFALIKLEIEK
ncbi:MAG: DUF1599 domain-containing protein [Bacteroidales bacterium]|nr:DUF1599 domain-containing protein [Bacteroidales bacterium]